MTAYELRISDWSSVVCSSDLNVTLEVTPKIAEKIAVAQTIGTLSLSLRSIADNRSELEQAIAAGDVTIPDDPAEEKKMLLAIASQPVDTRSTFATCADVSRFPLSTVPAKPQDNHNPVQSTASVPGRAPVLARPVSRDARGHPCHQVPVG